MTGPGPAATVAAMHTLRRAFVADDGRLNLVWRVVALVGMVLWMQHTGRLSWHRRLDDEGLPRSEAD